jgi:ferredoxin
VSEKNGGKAIVDNLIIQCKPCNVMQGSKNIDLSISLIEDYEMLDVIYDDLDGIMGENIMFCQAICATGAKCKNRAMFNRELCCVHLK